MIRLKLFSLTTSSVSLFTPKRSCVLQVRVALCVIQFLLAANNVVSTEISLYQPKRDHCHLFFDTLLVVPLSIAAFFLTLETIADNQCEDPGLYHGITIVATFIVFVTSVHVVGRSCFGCCCRTCALVFKRCCPCFSASNIDDTADEDSRAVSSLEFVEAGSTVVNSQQPLIATIVSFSENDQLNNGQLYIATDSQQPIIAKIVSINRDGDGLTKETVDAEMTAVPEPHNPSCTWDEHKSESSFLMPNPLREKSSPTVSSGTPSASVKTLLPTEDELFAQMERLDSLQP